MLIFEYEGKALLQGVGVTVPKSQLLTNSNESITISTPLILKAQTLSGKRATCGVIVKVEKIAELKKKLWSLDSRRCCQFY